MLISPQYVLCFNNMSHLLKKCRNYNVGEIWNLNTRYTMCTSGGNVFFYVLGDKRQNLLKIVRIQFLS